MYLFCSSSVYKNRLHFNGTLEQDSEYTLSCNVDFTGSSLWSGTQLGGMLSCVLWWGTIGTYLRWGTKLPPSIEHIESSFKQKREDHVRQVTRLMFLSKCNLWVRERNKNKKSPNQRVAPGWWSVVYYLQWKSLRGRSWEWWSREQRKQHSAHLFSPLLPRSRGSFQVDTKQENNQTQSSLYWLWDRSWVSSKCADPKSAMSRLLLKIIANIGNV